MHCSTKNKTKLFRKVKTSGQKYTTVENSYSDMEGMDHLK